MLYFPSYHSVFEVVLPNLCRYDVVVDVVPELKWNPEDGYKNLKIVVEIDKEIAAQTAMEQELRRRHKALGALRIVTDRGLEVDRSYFSSSAICLSFVLEFSR